MACAFELDDPGYLVERISDEVGKGLFATRAYRKEETIFREAPLISCQFAWNTVYGYQACHHCLEPLETAQQNVTRLANNMNIILPKQECCTTRTTFHVKCSNCQVGFCSKDCLEEAWNKYHKVLCLGSPQPDPGHPLVQLIELWKSFHYPPETVSIELIVRILAFVLQSDNPDESISRLMKFMHDTVNLKNDVAHKMLGENFRVQLEDLRRGCLQLFPQSEVQPLLTPDGFTALFALIGRNGQGIGTSPFSQWVKKVEKLQMRSGERKEIDDIIDKIYDAIEEFSGQFLDNEGSGLYELQSSINHSCVPNAEVEFPFNNHECVVNAKKDIEPGEEILISYLSECNLERSRHSRRKALLENYLFLCQCSKCNAQQLDPDVTSEEEMVESDS